MIKRNITYSQQFNGRITRDLKTRKFSSFFFIFTNKPTYFVYRKKFDFLPILHASSTTNQGIWKGTHLKIKEILSTLHGVEKE